MKALASVALLLVLLVPLRSEAAPPARQYLLGLPWETAIVEGIDEQNRAQRRRKPLDALVSQQTRRTRRNQSVENLYLLARAYGLRFSEARTLAEKSRSEAERNRLEAQASRDLASAQSTYRDALRADPRCYFAYHDLGVMELKRKNRSKRAAYDQFVKALQINTRYVDAIRKLVLLYLEGNQHKLAVDQLRRLLRLEPQDDIARTQLVVGLTKIALFDDALRELQVLLKRDPRNSAYRDLQAQILVKQTRHDEALQIYRDLSRENPNVPTAFVGMLRSLKSLAELDPKAPPRFDDYLFALRGLMRLERDPARRKQFQEDIAKMESAQHRPTRDPDQPVTADEVLTVLATSPNEEDRARAIFFFLSRDEPVTPHVVKAIASHLARPREPAARVRALAVRAVGHVGGTAVAGMVRLVLADPDATVRASAVDTLAVIGMRDERVRASLALVLGLMMDDPDVAVSAAARQAILHLNDVRLEVADDAPASAHQSAFAAWWRGPAGIDRIANGLERYGDVPDRFPEDILLAYLDDPSMLVGRAAYQALGRIDVQAGSARSNWLAGRPRFDNDAWKQESWEAIRSALQGWSRGRPQ